jgi:hypothetical protein
MSPDPFDFSVVLRDHRLMLERMPNGRFGVMLFTAVYWRSIPLEARAGNCDFSLGVVQKLFSNPIPDSRGWFESTLGHVPSDWPWALPHLYAVNVALDPAVQVAGASASPDGSYAERHRFNANRSRFEVIGYWLGEFRVIHVRHAQKHVEAEKQAAKAFDALPIRYLMHSGKIVRENTAVHITGSWPEHWQFQRYQDLGVLCAFIYEQARQQGAGEAVEDYRKSVYEAWPASEQIEVYRSALEKASSTLYGWLPAEALNAIHEALATIEIWTSEVR